MNSSMEPSSIKNQKIQAMKGYKRAKIVYNLVLYTLTSIITCFFFSSAFWFPSISSHFVFSSSFSDIVSLCFNAKCFFVVGNLIVIILVGESKLRQSSSSSDIYDEYVARSRGSRLHKAINGSDRTLIDEEKIHRDEENKKEVVMRSCKSEVWGESGMVKFENPKVKKEEQIKMGMRSSKSAVWGESGMVKIEKINKGKKKEQLHDGEKMKAGSMRSSKSAVWGESGMVKIEKINKGKKKEQLHDGQKMEAGSMRSSKSAVWGESGMVKMEKITKGKKEEQFRDEEKIKTGMRSSKSAVWSESERVKMEKPTGKKDEKFTQTSMKEEESEIVEMKEGKGTEKEEASTQKSGNDEEKKMGMRSCRSAVWGESESEKAKGKKAEKITHHEEKKMGMRSCRSEIWSEGEIVRLGKTVAKEEEEQQLNMLNKRVEDFIARVNKQRLFEAKVVDHSRG